MPFLSWQSQNQVTSEELRITSCPHGDSILKFSVQNVQKIMPKSISVVNGGGFEPPLSQTRTVASTNWATHL